MGQMKHSLHQEQLSSGVRVLFIDVPNSSTFSFNTVVRAGFKYADPKAFELPHLLEHLAFDGTTQHPTPADFAFALEGEGTDSNAYTSPDIIRYYYNGGRTDLNNIIALACAQLVDSTFDEAAIQSEKGVVESELSRLLENDGHMCWFTGMQHLEPELGLTYDKRIGQLESINREAIVDYYRASHVGNNTCVVLAGDFSRGKDIPGLMSLLNECLAHLPKGKERARRSIKLPVKFASKILLTNSLKRSEGYFELDFINTNYTDDIHDRAAMGLLSNILGGGSASRLFLSTRLKGLSYGPSSSYHFSTDFSEANLSDRAVPKKLLPLFKECVEQTFAVVRGDYTDAELERARGYDRGGYQTGFERPSDLAGWYANNFVWRKPLYTPDDFVRELNSVNRSEIMAMAKRFYGSDNWVLSLRAPEGSVDQAEYHKVLDEISVD